MRNIRYLQLRDELADQLNNYLSGRGLGATGEFMETKLNAPGRFATATTEAIFRFVRYADSAAIPDLYQKVLLTKDAEFRGLYSYRWPSQAFSEREDQGLLAPVIDEEELDWTVAVTIDQLQYQRRSILGGHNPSFFSVDRYKRRLYTGNKVKFEMYIVRRPDAVYSPGDGMYHGVIVEITDTATSDGDVTLSDGTNDVTASVTTTDTTEQVAAKIMDAVNADSDIKYKAWVESSKVYLAVKYTIDLGEQLSPSFDEGTTGVAYDLKDGGTLEIPVDQTYFDSIRNMAFSFLMNTTRVPEMDSEPAKQGEQNAEEQ